MPVGVQGTARDRREQQGWADWLESAYAGFHEAVTLLLADDVRESRKVLAVRAARAALGFGSPGPHDDGAVAFRNTTEYVHNRIRLHLRGEASHHTVGDPVDELGLALAERRLAAVAGISGNLDAALTRESPKDLEAYGRACALSLCARAAADAATTRWQAREELVRCYPPPQPEPARQVSVVAQITSWLTTHRTSPAGNGLSR